MDAPLGLAFGTSGDLFVASAGAVSNIARVDKNTGLVTNASFTFGNALALGGPQYLTFGPSLAVTDMVGHLFRFDAVTGMAISGAAPSTVIPQRRVCRSARRYCVRPNGLLYVAATNAIYRFDVSGASGVLVDSFETGGQFLAFTPSVPEPGTWAFMAAGLAVIAYRRRHGWR